jgi:hypothetical protein
LLSFYHSFSISIPIKKVKGNHIVSLTKILSVFIMINNPYFENP